MSDDLVKQRKVTEGEVCPDASSLIKWVVETELANRIEQLEERLENEMQDLDAADRRAKRLQNRIEELEAENHLLKTSGIAEVAVRNPSVMEYMQHWEGRAERAEAKLAKAVGELQRLGFDFESVIGREIVGVGEDRG